jgi:malate synthase
VLPEPGTSGGLPSSTPDATIGRTTLTVRDARAGRFSGSEIPLDLQRQWIQGTGPATKPHASLDKSIRNVAYALLSGADGWMFDGEDALGQGRDDVAGQPAEPAAGHRARPAVLEGAESVAEEDETVGRSVSRPHDRRRLADAGLDFTTVLFPRARAAPCQTGTSSAPTGQVPASIVDLAMYVVHNQATRAAAAAAS